MGDSFDLRSLSREELFNIATKFFGLRIKQNATVETIAQKIEKELTRPMFPDGFVPQPTEPPKYSVRVQRNMERKAAEEQRLKDLEKMFDESEKKS